MSELDLQELEALCRAASRGPWISWVEGRDHESGSNFLQTPDKDMEVLGATAADQDLMAAARTAIPELIARLRELEEKLER